MSYKLTIPNIKRPKVGKRYILVNKETGDVSYGVFTEESLGKKSQYYVYNIPQEVIDVVLKLFKKENL